MNRWICCIVLFFFSACSGKNDLPSGILSRDKMEDVMWDLIQADQFHREYLLKDSASKDVRKGRYELYEEVFKLHKINRPIFDKSYEYYSTRPKLMRDVFDSLSAKGNRRLQEFYKPALTPDSTIPLKIDPKRTPLKPR